MQVAPVIRRLGRAALDLVFPPRCAVCAREGAFLCDGCVAALAPAEPPRCPRCWQPGPDASPCLDCRLQPPAFDGLRAAFVYQGPARELIHALKYRGITALAGPMAALLAERMRQHRLEADLLVPVPLSARRRRARGYNQAEALARALAKEGGWPFLATAVIRVRHGPPQTRSADAEERRRNVTGAFLCREPAVAGKRVLLLDDVTTTGATLSSCAASLKDAGAASVWGLAFARED